MIYRGHIQGGVVVFDDAVRLPEGTLVEVVAPEPALTPPATMPTWADVQQSRGGIASEDALRDILAEDHPAVPDAGAA